MSFDRAKSALNGTRFADLRSVAETGSTNADVRLLLTAATVDGNLDGPDGPTTDGAYLDAPVVLLADHQSAGRGRLGRGWEAPPGTSVLMTIGYPLVSVPAERWTLMTMCLSLAVTDTTERMGISSLSIKWPNDLVVEDPAARNGYRKIGGILAETATSPAMGDCLIIGVGLNVNWNTMPEELAATAASLNSLTSPAGTDVDRDDLVTGILTSLDQAWLPVIEGPPVGLVRLFDAYRDRCSTLNRAVRVELPDGLFRGTATGVDPDGALVVQGPEGTRRITVGDVVHLRPDVG